MIENLPHEIVHKETGRTVGVYADYAQAYAAYQELGWEMTDNAIGLVSNPFSQFVQAAVKETTK
jgi:hypothetical protein